jgi:peptidoglycan hydrolase CwlO-like protein
MEDKLVRLEEQMKRLINDFRQVCEKNEDLRKQNDKLLSELLEKSRKLEVFEERDSVLMEAQAEKKNLEKQHQRIRKEVDELLEKIRSLKTKGK